MKKNRVINSRHLKKGEVRDNRKILEYITQTKVRTGEKRSVYKFQCTKCKKIYEGTLVAGRCGCYYTKSPGVREKFFIKDAPTIKLQFLIVALLMIIGFLILKR